MKNVIPVKNNMGMTGLAIAIALLVISMHYGRGLAIDGSDLRNALRPLSTRENGGRRFRAFQAYRPDNAITVKVRTIVDSSCDERDFLACRERFKISVKMRLRKIEKISASSLRDALNYEPEELFKKISELRDICIALYKIPDDGTGHAQTDMCKIISSAFCEAFLEVFPEHKVYLATGECLDKQSRLHRSQHTWPLVRGDGDTKIVTDFTYGQSVSNYRNRVLVENAKKNNSPDIKDWWWFCDMPTMYTDYKPAWYDMTIPYSSPHSLCELLQSSEFKGKIISADEIAERSISRINPFVPDNIEEVIEQTLNTLADMGLVVKEGGRYITKYTSRPVWEKTVPPVLATLGLTPSREQIKNAKITLSRELVDFVVFGQPHLLPKNVYDNARPAKTGDGYHIDNLSRLIHSGVGGFSEIYERKILTGEDTAWHGIGATAHFWVYCNPQDNEPMGYIYVKKYTPTIPTYQRDPWNTFASMEEISVSTQGYGIGTTLFAMAMRGMEDMGIKRFSAYTNHPAAEAILLHFGFRYIERQGKSNLYQYDSTMLNTTPVVQLPPSKADAELRSSI